jgi:hypothetical protein
MNVISVTKALQKEGVISQLETTNRQGIVHVH